MTRQATTPRENLTERMRTRGLRMTSQRRVLARLLENAEEHLDADEVYRLARKQDPRIHRATVYRTLNTLKKLGLIDWRTFPLRLHARRLAGKRKEGSG